MIDDLARHLILVGVLCACFGAIVAAVSIEWYERRWKNRVRHVADEVIRVITHYKR